MPDTIKTSFLMKIEVSGAIISGKNLIYAARFSLDRENRSISVTFHISTQNTLVYIINGLNTH